MNKTSRDNSDGHKERILLTDVLPFEVPLIFSNKHFYNLAISYKLKFDNEGNVKHDKRSEAFRVLTRKYFNNDKDRATRAVQKVLSCLFNNKDKDRHKDVTIPYTFRIVHNEIDYRELSIVHPRNQMRVVDFIDEHKCDIIDHCSLTPYSIRRPYKVSRDDKLHSIDGERGHQSENNYFSYIGYDSIHKFYESPLSHRCEMKYDYLIKFDISKCFDSIYTHSIAWAIHGKEAVKSDLDKSQKTFAGKFDTLMRRLSYNETSGIVVGPEFSRIFAEIILQGVDRNVYHSLPEEIVEGEDYGLFRYVDDYFLFFNDDQVKERIVDRFKHKLREYKLYINHAKSELFERPIITPLTAYKAKLNHLFKDIDEHIKELKRVLNSSENTSNDSVRKHVKEIQRLSNHHKAIIDFKMIVRESGAKLQDLLPYTLFRLSERVSDYERIISRMCECKPIFPEDIIEGMLDNISTLLETTFFIYAMAPRINSTIQVCSIISCITEVINGPHNLFVRWNDQVRETIFDKISDVLNYNIKKKYAKHESLYLLVVLRELIGRHCIDEGELKQYIGLDSARKKLELDYFQIIVTLYYMGFNREYRDIRTAVIRTALDRLKENDLETNKMRAESVMLLFDLLSCPYLTDKEKNEAIDSFGVNLDDAEKQDFINVILFQRHWFTKWNDFNILEEIKEILSEQLYY